MTASVRPRYLRHLATLKSISPALFNMAQAEAEAREMEMIRELNEAEVRRVQVELEFARNPHQCGTVHYS
jgi:hypothetical protein